MSTRFLDGLIVIELGERPAVASCGSLLAELGAEVVLAERPDAPTRASSKFAHRATVAVGKHSLGADMARAEDVRLLAALAARADVVLTSSDVDVEWPSAVLDAAEGRAIVCDITAFGADGPMAGIGYSDSCMQAFTGLADTTGTPEGAPTLCSAPILEFTAGTYAAAGVLAALRARRQSGTAQKVEVALHDVAISTLSTFLPAHHVGRPVTRAGNRHSSIAPWNAYRTSDGWVLVCTSSDEQWVRIAELMGQPGLATDSAFATPTERVRNVAELDAHIEEWSARYTTAQCIDQLSSINISCGPVYALAELFQDPNIVHRQFVREARDPVTGRLARVPGPLMRSSHHQPGGSLRIPRRDEDRALVERLAATSDARAGGADAAAVAPAPLQGIKVLEIGQYTTAPLAARQLGALGADVVKIETPAGDSARALPPQQAGQSYFFTIGNSDKRSIVVDLRGPAGQQRFRQLLAKADVLVENMRPGALDRLGLSHAEILRVNPRVVHCSISGFGHDAHYVARPAMDATIQGMSGIMDLTRSGNIPCKTGISLADIAGGQFGLLAILAALESRDRDGHGGHIDISMQDVSAWYTRFNWNQEPAEAAQPAACVPCADGYVVVDPQTDPQSQSLQIGHRDFTRRNRAQVVAELTARGIACASVQSAGEALDHLQTRERELVVDGRSRSGVAWPLLACPMRLSRSPVRVAHAISAAGGDEAEVLNDWGIGADATARPATGR